MVAPKYDSKYDLLMERITATFDKKTLTAIRRVAGRRGVSRFLQLAAKERLARLEIIALLDGLDEKHGPLSEPLLQEVARDAERVFRRKRS